MICAVSREGRALLEYHLRLRNNSIKVVMDREACLDGALTNFVVLSSKRVLF